MTSNYPALPRLIPCIWLNDQATAMFETYKRIFKDVELVSESRFPDVPTPSGKEAGSVMALEFAVFGTRISTLNGGPDFTPNPSISFFLHCEDDDEAARLFTALSQGGVVMMPLGAYPFSPCYGWVQDAFGVSWQLIVGRRHAQSARVVPCLMFCGAVHGRAEEALQLYASLFQGSTVTHLEHYEATEGPGLINGKAPLKHGRATLGEQDIIAMDSHIAHEFGFNEGLSLQVMCNDQAELDHFWQSLSDGGKEAPCGWLQDRFGVSWQVIPRSLATYLTASPGAANRVFGALMQMSRIDIAKLEAASIA